MARLLRSYGVSKLRPPTVVGAPVVFRPAAVKLVPSTRRARATHYFLRRPAVSGPISYTDSASGTLTFTGSSSETQTHTATGSGTVTFTGSFTQSLAAVDAASGTLSFTGSFTQTHAHTATSSGSITFTGSASESSSTVPADETVFGNLLHLLRLRRQK